ncbi:hypothetical protein [Roseateles sp.]
MHRCPAGFTSLAPRLDRFGRLGGEEFCVLLPDTDIAGAAATW